MSVDLEDRVTSWNPAAERLFGYPAAQIVGRSARRLVPGRLLDEYRRQLAAVHSTGPVLGWETRRRRADGREIPVSVSLSSLLGEGARPTGTVAVLRDLSGQHRLEELERSNARLRWAMEVLIQVPAGMAILTGPEHRFEFVNPAGVEMMGTDPVGRKAVDFLASRSLERYLTILDRVYTRGEPATLPAVSFVREGEQDPQERFFDAVLHPLREAGGEVEAILCHTVEVTETIVARRRVEELLARERRVAETLQRSLLPERLPEVAGLSVGVRYLAGGAGLRVGGDWYDVFPLPGGRIGVAIGDVVGRGLTAAATMARLRSALRALALDGSPPADVLEGLGRLIDTFATVDLATLVYGIYDPESSTLRFSSAGHPPPLLVDLDGSTAYLDGGRGVPLGAPSARRVESVVEVAQGQTVLLYTDGLIERRGVPLDESLASLRALAGRCAGLDVERLCEVTLGELAEPDAEDDVALLAFTPSPPQG